MGLDQKRHSSPPVTDTSMKYHRTCTHNTAAAATPPTFVLEKDKMSGPPPLCDANSCCCDAYSPCQSSKRLWLPKKNVFLQTHIKFFSPLWVHVDLRYILMRFQDEKQLSGLAGNLNNFCTSFTKPQKLLALPRRRTVLYVLLLLFIVPAFLSTHRAIVSFGLSWLRSPKQLLKISPAEQHKLLGQETQRQTVNRPLIRTD